jgi:hypothetical protein
MPIIHRYIEDFNQLENNRLFCGERLNPNSSFLIIGTFNPDANSCSKTNTAEWFYGRKKNNLWRFLPKAMGLPSLHVTDRPDITVNDWKQFCINHRIIIIDLIKKIDAEDPLPDFGDNEVEARINDELSNVEMFDIAVAFAGITFEKVIYSLSWSDKKIKKLRSVRDIVNNSLIKNGCIQNIQQIKYPNSPSRNDSFNDWNNAVNN